MTPKTWMQCLIVILLFAGWGLYGEAHKTKATASSLPAVSSAHAKTFFQSISQPSTRQVLQPDPFVMQSFPNEKPPALSVSVYLPVYPGATPTQSVTGIGDMGTPMTPDLVDGTVYFSSTASVATIESWYAERMKLLGYTRSGWGGTIGTSGSFIAFTHGGAVVGNPTGFPDINVGAITRGKQTEFKLKASYIIVPPRPAGTYLPRNVVKVTVTEGNQTHVMTDGAWIAKVVTLINGLQVSTMGITSCPGIAGGTQPIKATFNLKDGSDIPVTFGLPCGVRGVTVGRSNVMLGGSTQLDKAIESLFRATSDAH